MYGSKHYGSNFYATAHYGNEAAADDSYYKADHYQSNYYASDHYNGDGETAANDSNYYKSDHYQSNYYASDHYNGDGVETAPLPGLRGNPSAGGTGHISVKLDKNTVMRVQRAELDLEENDILDIIQIIFLSGVLD